MLFPQVTVKASAIVPARSAVLRGPMERAVLDLLTARLAAVSLAGYIFFGSSVNISDQVRSCASRVCRAAFKEQSPELSNKVLARFLLCAVPGANCRLVCCERPICEVRSLPSRLQEAVIAGLRPHAALMLVIILLQLAAGNGSFARPCFV